MVAFESSAQKGACSAKQIPSIVLFGTPRPAVARDTDPKLAGNFETMLNKYDEFTVEVNRARVTFAGPYPDAERDARRREYEELLSGKRGTARLAGFVARYPGYT